MQKSASIGTSNCHTVAMTTNDIYERLGVLEQLVRHLYEKTGIPIPDLQTLAQVSDHVRQLLASGNKIAAIKAYKDETGVDLPTASRMIESL
jgi:ribosomal protein L7/L12